MDLIETSKNLKGIRKILLFIAPIHRTLLVCILVFVKCLSTCVNDSCCRPIEYEHFRKKAYVKRRKRSLNPYCMAEDVQLMVMPPIICHTTSLSALFTLSPHIRACWCNWSFTLRWRVRILKTISLLKQQNVTYSSYVWKRYF